MLPDNFLETGHAVALIHGLNIGLLHQLFHRSIYLPIHPISYPKKKSVCMHIPKYTNNIYWIHTVI